MMKMMSKSYRMCPRCHRKGLHKSKGYPYWGDGTECCRYCSFTLRPGRDENIALAEQGGPYPRSPVSVRKRKDA